MVCVKAFCKLYLKYSNYQNYFPRVKNFLFIFKIILVNSYGVSNYIWAHMSSFNYKPDPSLMSVIGEFK